MFSVWLISYSGQYSEGCSDVASRSHSMAPTNLFAFEDCTPTLMLHYFIYALGCAFAARGFETKRKTVLIFHANHYSAVLCDTLFSGNR